MTGIIPTSFAGVALQVTNYETNLYQADSPYARDSNAVVHAVTGKFGRHVRNDPLGRTMVLHLTVRGGGLQAMQDALADIFPIGLKGDLVVDFDGSSRRVEGIVKQLLPYVSGPTQYDVVLTVPEPRWKSAALKTQTTNAPTAGIGMSNGGNSDEDETVFTFRPRTVKPLTVAQGYLQECNVVNRVPRAYINEGYNVAGTGWNHAAEVAAGRSLASGADVRVFVDGVSVDRWRGEAAGTTWNQATTQLWCNLTMSPRLTAVLAVACASGVSPANGGQLVVQKGGTAGWPDAGAILIENEVITYASKTDTAFLGITRGARNTTAAAHAISPEVTLFWIERRVQIVFGNAGAAAPLPNDHLKPLIDLTASTNTLQKWLDFLNELKPRSMQWSLTQDLTRDRQADHMAGKVSGASANGDLPALRLEYYQDPTRHNERPGNIWRRNFPSPVSSLNLLYTNSAYQAVGVILAVDDTGKERVVATCRNGSSTALGATAIQNATQLAFYARLFTAVQSYDAQGVAADVELSATAGIATLSTPAEHYFEPFTVPNLVQPLAYIEEIILSVYQKTGAGNRDVDVSLAILPNGSDPLLVASYLDVSVVKTVNITNTGPAQVRFTWASNETVSLRKDDVLYIHVKRGTAGTVGHNIVWQGGVVLYADRSSARVFHGLSLSLQQADNVLGGDGIFFSVDAVEATLAAATVPYVNLSPRQAIYNVNGTWTNTTTGQFVTFDALCTLNDVLEIDVGRRSFRNLTQGTNLFHAATFSDPVNWFTLQPGMNQFTYSEPDLVSLDIGSSWSDRWA